MPSRPHILPARLLVTVLLVAMTTCLTPAPVHAALFQKSPEKTAEDAHRAGMVAVTVWVDASWGFRKQGAANDLSAAHQAFTARGYRVASVEPYVENGDLEGFFVTYQKP